jgi:PAS domain-containing protein
MHAGRAVNAASLVRRMIMNARNAAEPKKQENEARQRKVRLSGKRHLIRAGNWEWNLLTKRYGWCDEMYRIFKVPLHQFPLRTGTFLNCVHPDDRQRVVRAFGKALAGESPYDIRHRIVWPDGSVRFIYGKATVTFDADGRPIRMWGTVRDVTGMQHSGEARCE